MAFGTPFPKNLTWTIDTRSMLLFALCSLCLNAASMGVLAQNPFPTGANTLFIGNSFFGPMARRFDEIALNNGFSGHSCTVVQRGGERGSPKSLWEEPKVQAEIEGYLAAGDIDLLGMTVGPESNSETLVSDYSNWIDLALEYNPNTDILIGLPWPSDTVALGSAGIDLYSAEKEGVILQIISELRDLYPNTQIFLIHYAEAASGMRRRFDDGMLPGIDTIVGPFGTSIHTDDFGHAGDMLREIVGLVWLEILYGANVESLDYGDWDEASVTSIVGSTVEYNDRYRGGNADGPSIPTIPPTNAPPTQGGGPMSAFMRMLRNFLRQMFGGTFS